MTSCVRDIDPTTPLVDPNCQIFEDNLAQNTRNEVAHCEEVDGAWIAPAGETVCFAELIDKGGQTPSEIDNMSPECVAEGYNLEFLLLRSPGSTAAAGTTISAACELSPNKGKDCPMI